MRLLRIAAMGLAGLAGTPFRTALAALGIVIGVSAVVTLTSLGNGIQKSVSGQINDLGPNLITVTPGSDNGGGGPFGADQASTLTRQDTSRVADLPSVRAASSNISTTAPVAGKSAAFSGVDPSYEKIRSVKLAAGRFLDGDGQVVLSAVAARDLLKSSPEEAVGKTLTVGGPAPGAPKGVKVPQAVFKERKFRVVGVARSGASGFGPPQPPTSYLSTGDALKISGGSRIGQILVSATSAEAVGPAERGINTVLKAAHGGAKDFTVVTQKELLSTFTRVTNQLNVFLAGIAGISLLVGGIGIMNIMLVSVAERTREIGVRKALGATDSDVLLQFLFEAILLAALGGLAGVAIGLAASELLPKALKDLPPAVFGAGQIGLAFGISALIGVLFGSLPAYRSARLAPVEALRRE